MRKLVRRLFIKPSIAILVALSALSLRADQSPEIISASSPSANSVIKPNAIVSDAAGNTFVTGSFSTGATFGTNILSSLGGFGFDDVYLVKYDPAGTVLWAKRAGGDDKEFGRALALDGQGGVYVTGTSVSSPASFGTNVLYNLFKSLFLAHYDANGNCLWARRAGATSAVAAFTVNALAIDPNGNPIVAGSFNGNPKFGGKTYSDGGIVLSNRNTAFPTSYEDMFVTKFSTNGDILWATNYGGTNTEFANAMAVDSAGSIYVAGGYKVSTTIGAQTYTNASDGILFAKLSGDGDVLWSSNLSDATNSNGGYGWSLVVDAADRITLGFEAKASVPYRFQGYALTNFTSGNQGFGILAQFDAGGNVLWLKRTPFNAVFTSPANASTLALDSLDNIYLGSNGREVIGSGFGVSELSVLKYNSSGLPIWTNTIVPNVSSMTTPIISVDGAGLTRVIGAISGDPTTRVTIGWTNYFPFVPGGNNQLLYTIASNFVAVAPQFVVQPTNMIFQPPQGLTNSALARAWPAPNYFWYTNGGKIINANNSSITISPTTFTNRTSYFVVASNAYGMATSQVVNAEVRLGFVTLPPTNIAVLVNSTLAIPATTTGTTAVAYQWRLNGTNITDATNATLALPNIATNQAGSFTLVISNSSAVLTSAPPTVVSVMLPGFVDPSFTNALTGALDLLRKPDGSYYVAKGNYIYHLNTDSSLDTNGPWDFSTGTGNGTWRLARESETQFMTAGIFAGGVARRNTNGTIDATFSTGTGPANTQEGSSFNRINSLVRLTNGQYLVGGRFNQFNGVAATNLVRLNTNGSLDLTFALHSIRYSSNPVQGPGEVFRIALQSDGNILVGGSFAFFDGLSVSNLVRLDENGTLDGTFAADAILKQPPYGVVNAILPLADGKILLGGAWAIGGNPGTLRLNTNGLLDATFTGTTNTAPTKAIVLLNNKIIAGGQNFIKRMDYDGALDTTFTTGTYFNSGQTEVMMAEPTGNLIVGGSYGVRRLWLEPAPVTLPTFSGANVAFVNGQFQFSACGGVDGQNIIVQASTNLVNWDNISTNIVSGGCISYADPQTPPASNRYYRLAVSP